MRLASQRLLKTTRGVAHDDLFSEQGSAGTSHDFAAEFGQVAADDAIQASRGQGLTRPFPVFCGRHQHEDAVVCGHGLVPPSRSTSDFPSYCGTPVITPRNSRRGSPIDTPFSEIVSCRSARSCGPVRFLNTLSA